MVMCFAPTCKHYSEKHGCTFFTFPKEPSELLRWKKLIRREDKDPSKFSRICSCHFVNGDRRNGPTIFDYNVGKQFSFSEPEMKRKSVQRAKRERAKNAEESSSSSLSTEIENKTNLSDQIGAVFLQPSPPQEASFQETPKENHEETHADPPITPQIKIETLRTYSNTRTKFGNTSSDQQEEVTQSQKQNDDSLYNFFISSYNATRQMPQHVQGEIQRKISLIIRQEQEKLGCETPRNEETSAALPYLPEHVSIKTETISPSASPRPFADVSEIDVKHTIASTSNDFPPYVEKYETFTETYEPL